MIRRFALLFVCTLVVTIAACNTAASNKEQAASSLPSQSAMASAPSSSQQEQGVLVDAKHISVTLPADWTSQNGEESFGFQRDGVPAGGLDGLGYSDTIDGLLPNGAQIDSQKEVAGMPVKTVLATLSMDAGGDAGKRQEYHFFFFLDDRKVVYDLRFDAGLVKESEAQAIARTVSVK